MRQIVLFVRIAVISLMAFILAYGLSIHTKIKLSLIEGVPYEKALELYSCADLVIDQVLIGWYGGLAVEVMKMGIPVAAYINPNDLKFVPSEFVKELPLINVSPSTLLKALEDIVRNREQLVDAGRRAKRFVEKWHAPTYVAGITHDVYKLSQ